jgi:arsenate reductase (thioredoxin)
MHRDKKRVLILCTGNSCRSQMAEGYFKAFKKDWEIFSAGITPKGLNPLAVQVMAEDGIDISSQTSDQVDQYIHDNFDYVITVCDHAKETCPVFLHAKEMIHWSFEDPAGAVGDLDEVMVVFRRVRDQIKDRVIDFLKDK